MQECSSVGRAAVSKTAGREFETLRSCHIFLSFCNIQERLGLDVILKKDAISQRKNERYLTMIKIRSFIENTMEEVRKCSWPNKDQLFESTLLVLFALVVVSAFVAAIDWILFSILKLLTA